MISKPYSERIISSKSDDEAAILSLFRDISKTDPSADISFTNIYKELPISNHGKIFDVKDRNVEFKTCPMQFAAINYCMESIIQAPFLNTSILGKLVYLDTTHQLVSLGDFSYAEVHINKRAAVRVRLKIPLNVNLNVDGNKISGVIRDVSMIGCCVTTPAGQVLEKAKSISLQLKLMHDNNLLEAHIPARFLRMSEGPVYKCALLFEHTSGTEKVLSIFVYQRQLEIIRELKEKS